MGHVRMHCPSLSIAFYSLSVSELPFCAFAKKRFIASYLRGELVFLALGVDAIAFLQFSPPG
jgi:hypothetical protein